MLINEIKQDITEWCRGKIWAWRALILLYFLLLFLKYLKNPDYSSVFGAINLGVHELGHMVFGIFGQFIGILGGTFAQILFPLGVMVGFYLQRDYFAICFSFGWLATSFYGVATYAADARSQSLPLVSPFGGETIIHDWDFILSKLGLLQFDAQVGNFFRFIGILSFLICLIGGVWLINLMIKTPREN